MIVIHYSIVRGNETWKPEKCSDSLHWLEKNIPSISIYSWPYILQSNCTTFVRSHLDLQYQSQVLWDFSLKIVGIQGDCTIKLEQLNFKYVPCIVDHYIKNNDYLIFRIINDHYWDRFTKLMETIYLAKCIFTLESEC